MPVQRPFVPHLLSLLAGAVLVLGSIAEAVASPASMAAGLSDPLRLLLFERVQARDFWIFFDYGRAARPTGPAAQVVDLTAAAFRESRARSIRITGYVDGDETREGKGRLASRRATVIRDVLVAKGIPASRISIVSGGTSQINGRPMREPQDRFATIAIVQ